MQKLSPAEREARRLYLKRKQLYKFTRIAGDVEPDDPEVAEELARLEAADAAKKNASAFPTLVKYLQLTEAGVLRSPRRRLQG